jgi:2-polyprenyl-3-methyl-5-hydroxy-6-metoxy-1,4-benzoquinol methylase
MSTEDDTPIGDHDQYVLGHSAHEIERLSAQARLYAPFTLSFFRAAGVTEGMRVLEVGCGGGDVSLLIAQLVGANGEVVGVDQSATAIETAQQRAQDLSAHNLRFLVADVTAADSALTAAGAFDAIIGRSVLEFIPDPAAVLRAVTSYVRPGGVIAFQEVDWSGCRALPAVPTFDQCFSWGSAALQRSGADPYIGLKLYPAFLAAGLPAPTLSVHAAIGAGRGHRLYAHIAGLMRTLLPSMETFGIATASEVDIESLEQRLADEVVAADATVVWVSLIGAASRTAAL